MYKRYCSSQQFNEVRKGNTNMKSPAEIAVKYESIGKGKTELATGKTFLLGIMAGAFIALGGLGSQIASCCAADPSSARMVSSVVFPIGLFMVLVGGAELFTGNCLIMIPVLSGKAKLAGMLKDLYDSLFF